MPPEITMDAGLAGQEAAPGLTALWLWRCSEPG
jgi:hypothetical protein